MDNICCICGKQFNGYGNNPEPVKTTGVCCDHCNFTVVIPERIKQCVGDPVPAGKSALSDADYADNSNLGSDDKYPTLLPFALKVASKTIGFELANNSSL